MEAYRYIYIYIYTLLVAVTVFSLTSTLLLLPNSCCGCCRPTQKSPVYVSSLLRVLGGGVCGCVDVGRGRRGVFPEISGYPDKHWQCSHPSIVGDQYPVWFINHSDRPEPDLVTWSISVNTGCATCPGKIGEHWRRQHLNNPSHCEYYTQGDDTRFSFQIEMTLLSVCVSGLSV